MDTQYIDSSIGMDTQGWSFPHFSLSGIQVNRVDARSLICISIPIEVLET